MAGVRRLRRMDAHPIPRHPHHRLTTSTPGIGMTGSSGTVWSTPLSTPWATGLGTSGRSSSRPRAAPDLRPARPERADRHFLDRCLAMYVHAAVRGAAMQSPTSDLIHQDRARRVPLRALIGSRRSHRPVHRAFRAGRARASGGSTPRESPSTRRHRPSVRSPSASWLSVSWVGHGPLFARDLTCGSPHRVTLVHERPFALASEAQLYRRPHRPPPTALGPRLGMAVADPDAGAQG